MIGVILTAILLIVKHVQMRIKIYAMNARMDTIVKVFPHVSLVQTIALSAQYAISAMVLVVKAVKTAGQVINATDHVQSTADSAINLTNHFVYCAKKTFMVTAVKTHAIRAVLQRNNSIHVIKSTVHVIGTVKLHFGMLNVTSNVERAVVERLAIERRVFA